MPVDDAPNEQKSGFFGWVSNHKLIVLGGAGVLAIGIYIYEKNKSSSSTTTTSTTSSALPTGSSIPAYPSAPNNGSASTSLYTGSAASSFAGQIATDFNKDIASSLVKYSSIRGTQLNPSANPTTQQAQPGPSSPSATAVTPKAVTGVPATAVGGKVVGTAVSPPSTISLKGISFKPTREVQYQGANWYGIPNAGIAAKLEKKGVTVKNILGGKGLYAKS